MGLARLDGARNEVQLLQGKMVDQLCLAMVWPCGGSKGEPSFIRHPFSYDGIGFLHSEAPAKGEVVLRACRTWTD